ncbi:MAG: hypothetical protein RR736_10585 [Pseudomonas sp.]
MLHVYCFLLPFCLIDSTGGAVPFTV